MFIGKSNNEQRKERIKTTPLKKEKSLTILINK